VSSHPGSADDHPDPGGPSSLSERGNLPRSAMGRHDVHLVGNLETLQHVGSTLHLVCITGRTHQDRNLHSSISLI
jgi:hypothetical protein